MKLKSRVRPKLTFFSFWLLGTLLIGVTLPAVRAQEASRTVDLTDEVDEHGDARIESNFQLSASKWAKWKDEFGDHPDILLRDFKYQMAAAVIDDFALDKDEVHRRAVAKIKARALALYRGDGQFQIQVPKNMKLVSGSGRDWVFSSSGLEEGGLVNMTNHAKLPENARNVHLTTGNDYNQLVYSLDVSPSKPKIFLYLGIALLLVAAVLGALSFRGTAKGTSQPAPAA